MEKLRAMNGSQYNFMADPETRQKLKHCQQFTERMLEVSASEGVILRRAVELLVDHYDKLQKKLKRGKEELKECEIYWLKRVSEPWFNTRVQTIPEGKPFMTYADRVERERRKVTVETILKQASAELAYSRGDHLTQANLTRKKPQRKRKGEQ